MSGIHRTPGELADKIDVQLEGYSRVFLFFFLLFLPPSRDLVQRDASNRGEGSIFAKRIFVAKSNDKEFQREKFSPVGKQRSGGRLVSATVCAEAAHTLDARARCLIIPYYGELFSDIRNFAPRPIVGEFPFNRSCRRAGQLFTHRRIRPGGASRENNPP